MRLFVNKHEINILDCKPWKICGMSQRGCTNELFCRRNTWFCDSVIHIHSICTNGIRLCEGWKIVGDYI